MTPNSSTFSDEQKQYLAARIKTCYPFLGQTSDGRFTNDPSEASEEFLHGTPIDELCKEELYKHEKHGLDVWDDILKNAELDIFPEDADMFRYKFYGLFHVKPAQDSFMLRARVPGGQINSHQLRGFAEVASDWGGGYADLTTRGNLQIREIKPRNTINTLIKLTELGLTSVSYTHLTLPTILLV